MITWSNETRRLSDLIEWQLNPKLLSAKQAAGLKASIKKFGFAVPLLVSPAGDIYDGHQRTEILRAIEEHGPDALVDVRARRRALTDAERRELVVRLKENQADWDISALADWDSALLEEWGIDADEIAGWNEPQEKDDGDAEPQIDRAEELREKWQVETGQLWQIGEHRLICGDALGANFQGADGILTDPPYDMKAENIIEIFGNISDKAMVVTSDRQAFDLGGLWRMRLDFIWYHRRPRSFPTKHMPVLYHNHCLLITRDGQVRHKWERPFPAFGSIIQLDGNEFEDTEMGHGKSAELFEKLLAGFPWQVVGDPFLGTGATVIACERLGRKCIGAEINPDTFAVALQRIKDTLGVEPQLC